MGLLDIIKSVFGKKVEKPSNTTRSYYGSNGNRLRFTPLKYFPKIEEKLLAFKADNSFHSSKPVAEVNRYMVFKNQTEIFEALGNPVMTTENEENGHIFGGIKYNITIYDYSVRLFFLLIDEEVVGFIYEFKEMFSQKSNKLDLIFRSIFNNYLSDKKYIADEFIERAKDVGCSIHDEHANIIFVSCNMVLTLIYIKDSNHLKGVFSSSKSRKEEDKKDVERNRLDMLRDNL
jgi:hypothetical protein